MPPHGQSRAVSWKKRRGGSPSLDQTGSRRSVRRILWSSLLHQFQSPLVVILLLAGVVTVMTGEYVDAGVIAAVLILNAAIGFFQEREVDLSALVRIQLVAPRARVVRMGHEREIDGRDVVPGDVILLESGGRVPADVRLVMATALQVDESLLTGESVPVAKGIAPVPEGIELADRTDMAYAGTVVASGRGWGYAPTVESYDIYFEPKQLAIPAGTDVTVTLPNEGVTLHNFSIDALGISVDIAPGKTKTVTINASAG